MVINFRWRKGLDLIYKASPDLPEGEEKNTDVKKKSYIELQRIITEVNRAFAPLRLYVILFLFASCSETKKEKETEPGKFFDLKDYFNSEANALNATKPEITKTIIKDGKTETKTFSDSIDWKKELKIFSENGINKPAWKDSYSADTAKNESDFTITYKTTDEKLSVKQVVIITDSIWQPKEISIKRDAKNFLYTSQQTMRYISKKSYRLDSEMNVRWTFDTKFSVEGVFNN